VVSKVCTKCGTEKPLDNFRSRGGNMKHLLKSQCNSCLYLQHKNWIAQNPEKIKNYREKDPWTLIKRCSRRGITPEELIDKYEEQGGKCSICLSDIDLVDSAIDHNHDSGKFRGVLCKTCNRALGLFRDNPEILRRARKYLIENGNYANSEKD